MRVVAGYQNLRTSPAGLWSGIARTPSGRTYASASPVPGVRQDYPSASSVVPKLSAVELEQVIKLV